MFQRMYFKKMHCTCKRTMLGNVLMGFPNIERFYVDGRGILRLRFNGGRRSVTAPAGVRSRNRIVVPLAMRATVLRSTHEGPMAGHMGQVEWNEVRCRELREGVRECCENKYFKPFKRLSSVHQGSLPIRNSNNCHTHNKRSKY